MHSRKAIESSNSFAPSFPYWTVLLVLRDIQRHYHFQKYLRKFTFVTLTIFGIIFGWAESGYAETSSATQEDTFSLNVKANSWSKLNSEKSSSESLIQTMREKRVVLESQLNSTELSISEKAQLIKEANELDDKEYSDLYKNKSINASFLSGYRNVKLEIRQQYINIKRFNDDKIALERQIQSPALSLSEREQLKKKLTELEDEELRSTRSFDDFMKLRERELKQLASRIEKEEAEKAVNANPTTRENARTAKLVDNVESLKAEFGEGPSGGIQCVNYKTDRDRTSGSGLPDYFCVWPERDYLQAQITISEATHSLETQSLYVYIMIVWPNQENLIFRKYAGIDLNRAKTSNFRAEDFPLLKEVCAKFSIWEQKLKNEGIADPFEKEMSGDYCFVWKDSKAMLAKKIKMMQGFNYELVARSNQISDIQFVINNFQSMLTSIDNFNVKNKLQKKSFEKNINKLLE